MDFLPETSTLALNLPQSRMAHCFKRPASYRQYTSLELVSQHLYCVQWSFIGIVTESEVLYKHSSHVRGQNGLVR